MAVAFVEPAPVGERFGKRHWPLHLTLLRFDMAPEAALAAVSGACERLTALRVRVGGEADFGYWGRVRVALVEHDAGLAALHEAIRAAVASSGGRIHSPQHTGAGFRPHVTAQGDRRVHEGQELVLGVVSLVDMAPGGDTEWREPVAEWFMDATGAASTK